MNKLIFVAFLSIICFALLCLFMFVFIVVSTFIYKTARQTTRQAGLVISLRSAVDQVPHLALQPGEPLLSPHFSHFTASGLQHLSPPLSSPHLGHVAA